MAAGTTRSHLASESLHEDELTDLFMDRPLDTTTPAGKAMFQMMGVFAEFERAMIQERVRAGLRRAKEIGTKSGKPIGRPTIDAALEVSIRDSISRGVSYRVTAKECGVALGTVQRIAAGSRPFGGVVSQQ
jgi:DNA invertase Pin-like site-specific DNA recombinase